MMNHHLRLTLTTASPPPLFLRIQLDNCLPPLAASLGLLDLLLQLILLSSVVLLALAWRLAILAELHLAQLLGLRTAPSCCSLVATPPNTKRKHQWRNPISLTARRSPRKRRQSPASTSAPSTRGTSGRTARGPMTTKSSKHLSTEHSRNFRSNSTRANADSSKVRAKRGRWRSRWSKQRR